MRFLVCGLALLFCSLARPAFAEKLFDDLSRSIHRLIDEHELPSAAVAVARDGRVLWEEGFGWADRDRRVPATAETPYSLASVSKPFTATAVMRLVEAGHLDLDRAANDYLTGALITGRHAERATVRRLLCHTGGLPAFYHPFIAREPVAMDEIITRYALLTFRPGRRFVYSNLGYGVLERMIERVSGTSYAAFLQREIFSPLHLESASVPETASPRVAVRYAEGDRPLPFYTLGHRGASSVYSSARDLVRFGMAHLEAPRDGRVRPVVSDRSRREMQRIHAAQSATSGYGLGWRIEETRSGLRQVGHTGGMPGVTTVLALYPAERVVVVVLTNTRSAVAVELARRIAARMMPLRARELTTGS
jgi:CubicO group peptidase (beta-lactamase class C family)